MRVRSARVNLPLAQAAVDYETGKTDLARMAQAVAAAGYSVSPNDNGSGKSAGAALEERSRREIGTWQLRLVLAAVLLVPLLAGGYAPHAWGDGPRWLLLIIGTVMQVLVGLPYFVGAANRLRGSCPTTLSLLWRTWRQTTALIATYPAAD